MRCFRFLSAVALALTALAIGVSPASAATTPEPDLRSFPGGLTCSGDLVSGVVRVYSATGASTPGRVELRYNSGGKAYASSSLVYNFTVSARGNRDYYFKFNIAKLPANTVNIMGYAVVGSGPVPIDTLQSKVLLASSCGPAEVVPEAPAAVLIPLSLAGTLGGLLLLRRRRAGLSS